MAQNETRVNYKFTAEDSSFKKVTANVGSELKKMAKDGTLGIAALSTAFYALGRSMQDSLNTMDQISKMSLKTGVSVESLSALKYAADLSGVTLESLEKSFIKLSKSVNTNSPAFSKLNIDLKNSNGTLKDNETVLMELADAFSNMEDGAQKTALAVDIFGKSGADMIPLLNGGSEAIKAQMQEAINLGVAFDEVAAKKAERFNDAITTLEYAVKGFTTELVTAFMPAIDSMSTAMEDTSGKSRTLGGNLTIMQAIARGLATGFYLVQMGVIGAGETIAFFTIAIVDAIKYLGSLAKMMYQFSTGDFSGGLKTWELANAKAFKNTEAMWIKLRDDSHKMFRGLQDTALGTGSSTGSTTKTGTGGLGESDETGGSDSAKGQKIKDDVKKLKTVEYDTTEKMDKQYASDLQEWLHDNQKASVKEKLKIEEYFLKERKQLWEDYIQTTEFQENKLSDPDFSQKVYSNLNGFDESITKLSKTIKELDATQKANNIFKNAQPYLAFADSTKAFKEFLARDKAQYETFVSDNPPFEWNVFDQIKNEQSKSEFNFKNILSKLGNENNLGYTDPETGEIVPTDYKKMQDVFSKRKADYIGSLNKGVDYTKDAGYQNILDEEEFAKLRHLDKIEKLEKNHKDYLKSLEEQLWESKMNIWSNAMGALANLFAENTIAYKAFAIAQATIDAWVGANAALKLSFPLNWIQFASVLATGLGSVTKIMDVKIPAFANGGLVNSPTLGIMGEAGAEIIAPERDFLDYTNNIKSTAIAQSNSNMFSNALKNMKFKLVGKDLVLAYDKNKLSDTRLRTA